MSTEALNRIIKAVNALTPQERRKLIDRLAHEEQNSQELIAHKPATLKRTVNMAPDFNDSALSNSSTHEEEITTDTTTLCEWLNEARNMRTELPLTSDSVDTLRELREVRSRQ